VRPLPGISFETVAPAQPDTLPRMDVAAFVGLASSGPLDVPVPVEDVLRFRDVFGEDPPLAWDAASGRSAFGLLGPAVEAFFQNGGRRCFVVRVAGGSGPAPGDAPRPGDPWTHLFPVPGLAAAGGSLPAPLLARARAPGSWSRTLAVSATLLRRPVGSAGALAAAGTPPALSLEVAAPAGAIGAADLVEVEAAGAGLLFWLEVDQATAIRRGVGLSTAPGRFWVAYPAGGSPPPGDPVDRTPEIDLLDPGAAAAAVAALPPGSPLRARVISFELTVSQDGRPLERIADLAFSPRHPRFWGALPDDVELFAAAPRPRRDGRDDEAAAFRGEAAGDSTPSAGASGKRFALAGPASFVAAPEDWPVYLPSGMDLVRRVDRAVPALPAPQDLAAQDGLPSLGAVAFLDDRLGDLAGESLLATARALDDAWREWTSRPDRRPAPRRLRGLHALVGADEATLLAVPDAALPAWTSEPAPMPDLLGAPALDPVSGPDALGRLTLAWNAVAAADGYHLEWDESPDFPSPAVALDGLPDPSAGPLPAVAGDRVGVFVLPAPSCARQLFFRVRAARLGEPSPWSQTRPFQVGLFAPCDEDEVPELVLGAAGSPPTLSWGAAGGAPLATDARFTLQLATDALFESGRPVLSGGATSFTPGEPSAIASYYRVRAERPDAAGPWSATVVLPPLGGRPSLVSPPSDPTDAPVLLAVQRALLRLAAAAGDRLALLALPRHHRLPEATAYLSALLPDETAPEPGLARPAAPGRSLTLGEESALSFGAVFHPWVARLATRGGTVDVDVAPPEGAVAGLLAQTALDAGAWRSSANQPLAGVLALEPTLTDADARGLADLQLDPLVASPSGFVIALDDTLSRDSDTRPLTVRRLLALLRRLALREGTADVFEPQSTEFVERVRLRFGRLLADLHHRGAFRGRTADEAFAVVADGSVNPPQSLDLGRFVVELRVAPSRPLRFLRVQLLQTAPEQVAVTTP